MAAGAGAWVRPYRNGFRVYYRLEPGGVLHGTKVFPTADEADRVAADTRSKITTRRRTVGDAIEDWKADMLARAERGEMRRETGPKESARVVKLCADALQLPLGSLTPRKAGELYAAYAESGASAGTHHRALRAAKAWGGYCVKRGWWKVNPWSAVEAVGAEADLRDVCLRTDEARAYVETGKRLAREGDEGALAALLPVLTSLLPSELLQIAARDVDDGGAVLWVAGSKLKTSNRRRRLDILDPDLRELLAARADGRPREERIFDGNGLWVTAQIRRVAKLAGVGEVAGVPVGARELRRTFATLDARRGSSLDAVAFNLGHGADGKAKTARKHYIAHGAAQSGAARRVLGVLDGGKARRKR